MKDREVYSSQWKSWKKFQRSWLMFPIGANIFCEVLGQVV